MLFYQIHKFPKCFHYRFAKVVTAVAILLKFVSYSIFPFFLRIRKPFQFSSSKFPIFRSKKSKIWSTQFLNSPYISSVSVFSFFFEDQNIVNLNEEIGRASLEKNNAVCVIYFTTQQQCQFNYICNMSSVYLSLSPFYSVMRFGIRNVSFPNSLFYTMWSSQCVVLYYRDRDFSSLK